MSHDFDLWVAFFLFLAPILFAIRTLVLNARVAANEAATANAAKKKDFSFYCRVKRDQITQIIIKHLPALALKQQQSISQDCYGVMDVSGWNKEIKYFIDVVISPEVRNYLDGTDSGRGLDAISAELDKLNAPNAGKVSQAAIDNLKSEIELIRKKNTERVYETTIQINDLVSKYRINEIENAAAR